MAQCMIVKVQRPIVTSEPIPMVLIYNEDNSLMHQAVMTPKIEELFGERYKIYLHARYVRKSKKLYLDDEAPEQPW